MRSVVPSRIELRIPRSCEYVRVARKTAGALAHQLGFTISDVGDIELAISEACTNAVEHVSDESCEEVLLRLHVEEQQLLMEVIDRGTGFDPSTVEEGVVDEDTVGGLGILVIRSLMDELEITSDDKAGTRVRMVKYIKRQ